MCKRIVAMGLLMTALTVLVFVGRQVAAEPDVNAGATTGESSPSSDLRAKIAEARDARLHALLAEDEAEAWRSDDMTQRAKVAAGANANATLSLDLIPNGGSGNRRNDAVTSGTVSGQDTKIAIEVFATGVTTSLVGMQIRFDFDATLLTYVKAENSAFTLPLLASTGGGTDFAATSPVTLPSSGFLTRAEFTTATNVTGREFSIGIASVTLSESSSSSDTLTTTNRIEFNATTARTPDFDGDGVVNFSDFMVFAGQYGSRRGDGRYQARYDLNRDGAIDFPDFLSFAGSYGGPGSPPGGGGGSSSPDLIVESPSVSDSTLTTGQSFTLRATVRNSGTGSAASTTLRYYRSSNSTISTSDTEVGTDSVSGLSASNTSAESISLTAPSSAGTYYYGACVASVSGESNSNNNCSTGVRLVVEVERANTFDQTVAQIQALEAKRDQNWALIDQMITEQRGNHPLAAPKGQFETTEEYETRQSQLDSILLQSRRELLTRYRLEETRSQIMELYHRVFPVDNSTTTLGTYNANSGYYPITFEATINGESQRYNERLIINRDDARSLYNNWDNVVKTGYISIDPGYRQALTLLRVEYPPIWSRGIWLELNNNVVYDLGNSNTTTTVAFSPDGKHLATGARNAATIWNLSSGEGTRLIIEQNESIFRGVTAVAFSPTGNYLAIGSKYLRNYDSGWAKTTILEVSSGRIVDRIEHGIGAEVYVVAFNPGGNSLATLNKRRYYSTGDRVNIYPLNNQTSSFWYLPHGGSVYDFSYSQDGKYLATGSQSRYYYSPGAVTIWDLSGAPVGRKVEHDTYVYAVAFSPDGKYLATGDRGNKVTIKDGSSGENIQQMEQAARINDVAFSPDGKYLAVGDDAETITFYRIPTNITLTTRVTKEKVIRGSYDVEDLAWSAYGRFISDGKKVYRTLLQPEIQED